MNINRLLPELARAVLGNIGPRSWQYGPSEARKAERSLEKPIHHKNLKANMIYFVTDFCEF